MKKSGFILALLGLIFSVIPFLNYAGMVMAFIALPFGIVGIIKDKRAGEPNKKSLTTIIMSSVAIVLSMTMSFVYIALIFGAAAKTGINLGNF